MLLLTACGAKNPKADISTARQAIVECKYDNALSALDAAKAAMNASTASPSSLAEVAVLYMVVDELAPDAANHVKALECYSMAYKINADSVAEYALSLSGDEMSHFSVLEGLYKQQALNDGIDIIIEEMDAIDELEQVAVDSAFNDIVENNI